MTGRAGAAVDRVAAGMSAGEPAELRLALHPYVHWTEGGVTTRGRNSVLAHLAEHRVRHPALAYELRDGQVYRWTTAPDEQTTGGR